MKATALESVYYCINDKLQSMRQSVSAQDYHTVVSLVERKAPIDYDRYAAAFALHYMWPNALKAKRAIESSRVSGSSFIDLGCGPGSASLGALMASLDRGAQTPRKFLLVDRSLTQIQLAVDILNSVRDELGISFTLDVLQADVLALDLGSLTVGYDTVLISHLLCELDHQTTSMTQQLASAVSASNRFVIIEQVDDAYWGDRFYSLLRRDQIVEHSDHLASLQLPSLLAHDSPKERWQLRWRTLQGPPHSWMGSHISEYFRAWCEADLDAVRKLFTDSAEYLHLPNCPPITNSRAIEQYWKEEILDKQSNIDARPIEVGFASQRAWVYWSASYTRKGGGDRCVIGIMVLDFDLDRRRIRRLTEVYRGIPAQDLEGGDQWLR